jgi:hypothetical protein
VGKPGDLAASSYHILQRDDDRAFGYPSTVRIAGMSRITSVHLPGPAPRAPNPVGQDNDREIRRLSTRNCAKRRLFSSFSGI